MTLSRRSLLAAASLAALAGRAAADDLPAPHDLAWTAAGRPLRVLVRWPAAAPREHAGWPVVLYSHGLGGSRQGGFVWGEAWARAGFVVVHLQHAGSDVDAVRRARNVRSVGGGRQLLERLQDVQHALDQVASLQAAGSGPWRQVRASGFGLAGHSFGAHTTLGMAGQTFPGAGAIDEPRIAAFAALSPTVPPGDARAAFAGVQRPVLVATGTLDGDVLGTGATPDTRRAVFDALPAGHKALLLLRDADHMTFGGNPRATLPWQHRSAQTQRLEPAQQALVAQVTTDWWRTWLQDDDAARARLQRPAGLGPEDLWQLG
ncbi:MAG: alpha/beta hydrolase family protein [Ramlibacter sp.]